MFMRVDLPAPFSPRRAWTSPLASSKSTWSFATTPGKRLVMPFNSRSGASAMARDKCKGASLGPAPLRGSSGLAERVRNLERPVQDLLLDLVDLVEDALRHLRAHRAETHAVLLEAEGRDASADRLAL